jgi:hypothetical protein
LLQTGACRKQRRKFICDKRFTFCLTVYIISISTTQTESGKMKIIIKDNVSGKELIITDLVADALCVETVTDATPCWQEMGFEIAANEFGHTDVDCWSPA